MRNYLDLVVESLPVTIAVRDAHDGRFISINRAGEALIGRPREAVIGRTWHQLYPRAAGRRTRGASTRGRSNAGRWSISRARASRTADGRPLTVHRRVLPVFEAASAADRSPRPRYLMSIVDDLTDTVRTEAALQDTEAHFRELAEHIDAFVFIADRNLATLTYVSPRCEALLGIPAPRLQADPRLALERVQAAGTAAADAPTCRWCWPGWRGCAGPNSPFASIIRRSARAASRVRFTPVRTPRAGDLRIFGMAEDATEREAAQDQRAGRRAQDARPRDARSAPAAQEEPAGRGRAAAAAGVRQTGTDRAADRSRPRRSRRSALVHGMQPSESAALPLVALVQGIFSSLAAMYNVIVQLELPGHGLSRAGGWRRARRCRWRWSINELGGNCHQASRQVVISASWRD